MSVKHRVEDYVAGGLGADERAEFERHLASCEACKAELQALQGLRARLSTWYAQAVPSAEPRREWVEQVKAGVRSAQPTRTRRLLYVGTPAIAVALVLILLFVFRPWKQPLAPDRAIAVAYEATMGQTFRGTISVSDDSGEILAGTFGHAPGDRWNTSLRTSAGHTIDEIQVQGKVWQRRDGGPWAALERPELPVVLPHDMGPLDRVSSLMEGISTVSTVSNSGAGRYAGIDRLYLQRLERSDFSGQGQMAYGVDGLPSLEVTIQKGLVKSARLDVSSSASAETVLIALSLGEYGAPVAIEPPMP